MEYACTPNNVTYPIAFPKRVNINAINNVNTGHSKLNVKERTIQKIEIINLTD